MSWTSPNVARMGLVRVAADPEHVANPQKYTAACPFDCTKWEECVCKNTAKREGDFNLDEYLKSW